MFKKLIVLGRYCLLNRISYVGIIGNFVKSCIGGIIREKYRLEGV